MKSVLIAKLIHYGEQIGYFLLAIFFFNSIGVWFPIAIDYYNCSAITGETYKATPYNLLTYFLGMVSVAIIDRFRKVLIMNNHPSKFLELLFWIAFGLGMLVCGVLIMKSVKDTDVPQAIKYGIAGSLITYIVWWLTYLQPYKSDAYSTLGGNNFD